MVECLMDFRTMQGMAEAEKLISFDILATAMGLCADNVENLKKATQMVVANQPAMAEELGEFIADIGAALVTHYEEKGAEYVSI